MRRHAVMTVCLLAVLLVGCISDQAARYYADTTYPPKSPDEVELLQSEPSRPYEVIADFQARGGSIAAMRKKAAKIGADAVIVSTFGGYRSKGDEWASDDTHGNWYSRIVATAIVYIHEEQTR